MVLRDLEIEKAREESALLLLEVIPDCPPWVEC